MEGNIEMKKILFVDDEIAIFNIIKHYLRKNYIIDYAHNGQEGLSLYNRNNYDIIFTDFSIPIMNGTEMIKEIRKKDKKIPIILLTGNEEVKVDNVPTIHKPFSLYQINQTLQKI